MSLDAALEGCFGTSDLIFAWPRASEDHALAWLAELRAQKLVWPEVETQIRTFLLARGVTLAHAEAQLLRAGTRFKPWL